VIADFRLPIADWNGLQRQRSIGNRKLAIGNDFGRV
jgi:hypothetical protein